MNTTLVLQLFEVDSCVRSILFSVTSGSEIQRPAMDDEEAMTAEELLEEKQRFERFLVTSIESLNMRLYAAEAAVHNGGLEQREVFAWTLN
jgi:hypothetical protein